MGQLKLAERIDYLKEKVEEESNRIEEDVRLLRQFEGRKEQCPMQSFSQSGSMSISQSERR